MDRKKRILYVLVIVAITLSCAPLLPSIAIPTIGPGAVDTIVAATYRAASTATAEFAPTSTATPTITPTASNTPTPTPSPTNTIIFRFVTLTPVKVATAVKKATSTSGGGGGGGGGGNTPNYKCSVISVTPANNSNFAANASFTAQWKVKNTGNIKWDENSVDYLHVSGTSMHLQALYDLTATVKAGSTITLPVNMQAPASAGTYSTTWNLRVGAEKFCAMKITIVVP